MSEARSLASMARSWGKVKMAEMRGKKPQKMETKNKRPICERIPERLQMVRFINLMLTFLSDH